jgi:hypothetical protein
MSPHVCIDCDSPGDGNCSACHGSGRAEGYSASSGSESTCYSCGGSGHCSKCEGSGEVEVGGES